MATDALKFLPSKGILYFSTNCGGRIVAGWFKCIIFVVCFISTGVSLIAQWVKNPPAMQETPV